MDNRDGSSPSASRDQLASSSGEPSTERETKPQVDVELGGASVVSKNLAPLSSGVSGLSSGVHGGLAQVLGEGWRGRRGPTIAWRDVSVTVVDRVTGGPRCILKFACGLAQPGRLLAVMGPSGAGKSTLMDVLAGNTVANMQSGGLKRGSSLRSSLRTVGSLRTQRRLVTEKAAKRAASSSDGMAVSGRVLVDGAPRRLREFRDMSCYVQQQEVLMASASVREALTTAALLKLPYSVSKKGVEQRVAAVLEELDLTGCADTLIGDALQGLKGISGGQKRRVSVGIELVKDPRVLFLDEPTSGLDSEAANSLMGTLRRLARMGRTVIATIHQPNSTIAAMFDDFTLLAAGRVVYGGPWNRAVDFFGGCGYPCPPFTNPTEYFMAVVSEAGAVDCLADKFDLAMEWLLQPAQPDVVIGMCFSSRMSMNASAAAARIAANASARAAKLSSGASSLTHGAFPTSPLSPDAAAAGTVPLTRFIAAAALPPALSGGSGKAQPTGQGQGQGQGQGETSWRLSSPGGSGHVSVVGVDGQVDDGSGQLQEEAEQEDLDAGAVAPLWLQTLVLARRYARFWVRTPGMLTTEVIQYAFYGIFFGAVFYRFRDVLGKDDFRRAACIWTSLTFMCFVPSTRAVTAWEEQRKLLKYELGQRLYGVTVYYLSRYLVLLPMEMAQTALFVAILYFFVGFYASAGHFFLFMLVVGMCQIIGEGIGAISSAVTRSQSSAFLLLNIVLLLCVAFVGLLIPIPVYFNWAMRTSYVTYAYTCLVSHEFQHLTFVNPATGALVPGPQAAKGLEGALSDALPYGLAFLVLACQLMAMEVLKLLSFHYAVWRRLL